jgi:predicted pyridoxine 5'-phosphate oxidase superfamily flavin-nucleotide-binding protein
VRPDDFYHDGSRALQRDFGTYDLAGHLAVKYVLEEFEPEHVEWIHQADCVYVATIDPSGQPECSYKGGLPGFIRVTGPRGLEIPSYDGNGMYRTLGNAAAVARIGLLFLFPELKAKLRVNGTCEVVTDAAALAAHHGAEAVVRVGVTAVFENCPRYLHDRANGRYSKHCPRPGYQPPDPDWKLKPEYDGLLPHPPTAEGRTL